ETQRRREGRVALAPIFLSSLCLCVSVVQFFVQPSQIDLVVLAQPLHQRVAAVAQVVDLQLARVRLLLLGAPRRPRRLRLVQQSLPLLAPAVALAAQLRQSALGGLLVQVPARQRRRGVQHRPLTLQQAGARAGQVLAGLPLLLPPLPQ